jgi:hypothetical protein
MFCGKLYVKKLEIDSLFKISEPEYYPIKV